MSTTPFRGLSQIGPVELQPERKVIGLTGNVGAGKSTVAHCMETYGARIIDADTLGHRLLLRDSPVFDTIVQQFGENILNHQGEIERSKLGSIVFRSPQQLNALNQIVHPIIVDEIKTRIHAFRTSRENGPLVIDAALIFEWGALHLFDGIVVVAAPLKQRQQRFQNATTLPEDDFLRREQAQMAETDKIRQADAVIYNDSDLDALERRIKQFMKS